MSFGIGQSGKEMLQRHQSYLKKTEGQQQQHNKQMGINVSTAIARPLFTPPTTTATHSSKNALPENQARGIFKQVCKHTTCYLSISTA